MEAKSTRKGSLVNFSILGFPDDLGVKQVGGRPGAAGGPDAFLTVFKKMNGKSPVLQQCDSFLQIKVGERIEENHHQAKEATCAEYKKKNRTVVVMGGGHDYAYSWIAGIRQAVGPNKKIAVINLDAHFDLRPYESGMTSGSPFRRLIDEKIIQSQHLYEFGIQNHCNRPELWEFAKSKKIPIITFENIRNQRAVAQFRKTLARAKKAADLVLLSLDLDCISSAFAPGVSAPQSEGLTASEVFQILEIAGADKKVTSLGVFELAPNLDSNGITVRCAAQGVWKFLDKKLK